MEIAGGLDARVERSLGKDCSLRQGSDVTHCLLGHGGHLFLGALPRLTFPCCCHQDAQEAC